MQCAISPPTSKVLAGVERPGSATADVLVGQGPLFDVDRAVRACSGRNAASCEVLRGSAWAARLSKVRDFAGVSLHPRTSSRVYITWEETGAIAGAHALRDADAVVLSAGAHFMTADSMRARLSRAAAPLFSDGEPQKRVAVLEYSPVHFAGTEDREYHPGLHDQLQNAPRTCVPHNSTLLVNGSTSQL